ncbi:15533_t:CDS:2 [Funneliformis mosseae]|uniref:15533_t:CDS:1 n=1 Tax=Funneliformis mosseae TaxID=27381 RepID=A0A9N8UZW7_FUNMO|nr:15533_t:CDS:2 [Funneliformis mosseae]
MHSIFISSILLLCSALFASADYGVSSPPAGEIFKIGDKLEIKWTVGNIIEPSVDVKLVHGPAENLQLFRKLCTLDPKEGTCTTIVDESIPSGIDYAIIVAGKETGFSSYFTIQAKGPLPENKGCPKMGGKDCPENLPCCSASGFCGATEGHCGTGCDPKHSFNGKCQLPGTSQKEPVKEPVKEPEPTPEPPSNSINKCGDVICTAEFPCCSEFNFCGSTPDHCGNGCQAGKSFNGVCITKGDNLVKQKTSLRSSVAVKCGKEICNSLAPCCSEKNVQPSNTAGKVAKSKRA